MPVPIPKRSQPPNPQDTLSTLKKRQLEHVPTLDSGLLGMNGHSKPVRPSNGSTATQRRRRTTRRQASESLSSSSSSSQDLVSVITNGNGHLVVEKKAPGKTPPTPPADSDDITFEEWQGIMKQIVEKWEIPRKVLHSSIGAFARNYALMVY